MSGAGDGSSTTQSWPRRRWRWLAAAAVLLVVAVSVGALAAWHFSSQVVIPDHSPRPTDVTVEGRGPGRITLSSTPETRRPGVYGLQWQGGRAIVGELVSVAEGGVTRRLQNVDGYLPVGSKVAVAPVVFAGDPRAARGLPSRDVEVEGELGAMPAWLVPGRSSTWAIFVHGINSDPETGLRIAPTLHRAGLPTLLITYREDLGAPPSPDGKHHMGLTEWRDLEAAARYALAHGARRLVLVGYSMGGTIVTQFMQRSPLADRVSGLVLDAPALNWQEILAFNATEMGLPSFLSLPVEWAIGMRIDVDWGLLDALDHTDDLRLPVLLFHGEEDDVVPISTSDELAAALPRWVTYYRLPRAGHTESWNVDPGLYERRLASFLSALPR